MVKLKDGKENDAITGWRWGWQKLLVYGDRISVLQDGKVLESD
jgi:hypothetical protein